MAFSAKRTGFSVVTRSLTEAEASSHRIDLGFTPRFPQSLLMFVADGGGHRVPGVDFQVEGSVIDWTGKELEILEPGDLVSIVTG
jgi:hypothetical protein